MNNSISLPLWTFMILLVFAIIMVLDRFLMPGFRWVLRKRIKKAMDEVGSRLDIKIRPFQLTRREGLIDQLLFDEQVMEAVKQHALENDMPMAIAQEKVKRYAMEIVPAFNAYIYFRFGYWLARTLARLLYRVRVGFFDKDQLKQIPPDVSVVFIMNHRSNMDYVLVSFLVAEKSALSYAVGEWARIWPLQSLVRSMGAFFVRRNSANPLYRKVLERYVHLATRAGVCQAVYPEGGLSKQGHLLTPKLGFLDYMIRGYRPEFDRDIVFVPVGINYDRVIEDRSLIRKLDPQVQDRNLWFVLKTGLRFFFKTVMLSRKLRWRRFGYASVNFGPPVSLKQYCQARQLVFSELETGPRFEEVKRLADALMQKIAVVIPILPVALMSEIVLANRSIWKSELDLKAQAIQRIAALKHSGAPIAISDNACEGVLNNALEIVMGRGLVEQEQGLLRMAADAQTLLEYYANSISHWL